MSRDHSRGRTLLKPVVLTTEPVGGEPADGALAIARAEDLIDTQGFGPQAYASYIADTSPSGPLGRHPGAIGAIIPDGAFATATAFPQYNPGNGAIPLPLFSHIELVVFGASATADLDDEENPMSIGSLGWPGLTTDSLDPSQPDPALMVFTSGRISIGQNFGGRIEFSLQCTVLSTGGPPFDVRFSVQESPDFGPPDWIEFAALSEQALTLSNTPTSYGEVRTVPKNHIVTTMYRVVGRRIGGPAGTQNVTLTNVAIRCKIRVEGVAAI